MGSVAMRLFARGDQDEAAARDPPDRALGDAQLGGIDEIVARVHEHHRSGDLLEVARRVVVARGVELGDQVVGVEARGTGGDLTLDEAAMIAGLFQTWRNAPTVNMDRAMRRRAYVLQQMADNGFITQKDADAAKARPIALVSNTARTDSIAPYFLEEVRKELEGRYGAKQLYENGLTVQTALDLKLQDAANRALERK